jgi:hypothetical protein
MRQPQFIRSNTFHWAFIVAGVFAVFIIVLFGFIYWKIDDYLTARSDRVITAQLDGIAALPPERRLEAIDERLRQDPRGVQLAAVFAADGHRISGNLESLPPDLRIDAEAQGADIIRTDRNGRERQTIRAIARRMRNGDVLVLGRNVDEAKEISHVVGQALALGLLPGFSLCLLAGAWLSVRAQRRVEEVNQRVQRIIAGDLRELRLTLGGCLGGRADRNAPDRLASWTLQPKHRDDDDQQKNAGHDQLGVHGANKAEVACSIIRDWLWDNQGRLRENGISIVTKRKPNIPKTQS